MPAAAGFEPSNFGSWINCFTIVLLPRAKNLNIFDIFTRGQGVEPSNFRSGVNCSTTVLQQSKLFNYIFTSFKRQLDSNLKLWFMSWLFHHWVIAASQAINISWLFSLDTSSSWIQTLKLRIMNQLLLTFGLLPQAKNSKLSSYFQMMPEIRTLNL